MRHAARDAADLFERPVLVVQALHRQQRAADGADLLLDRPLPERRMQPDAVPAPERRIGVVVVARQAFAQVGRRVGLAGLFDLFRGDAHDGLRAQHLPDAGAGEVALTDVHAVVTFASWVEEGGTRRRRFDQLSLERDVIIFMPLHWVVVHPITESSPLRGLTAESLLASDPEIVCLITADDETFAQTVHARTSYDRSEVVWGARFRDMYLADVDHVAIDLSRLHQFEPVEPPPTL